MLKFGFEIVLALAVFVNSLPRQFKDHLIVTLDHGGKVHGQQKSLNLQEKYFSFKGIPYAVPPLEYLQLRSPKPHPDWTDIRNATQHGEKCIGPAMTIVETGAEDCLFLNVYSPSDLNPKEK